MANKGSLLPVLLVALVLIDGGQSHFFRPHGEKVVDHFNGLRDTLKQIDHNIKASIEQTRSHIANGVHQSGLTLGSLVGIRRVPNQQPDQHPTPPTFVVQHPTPSPFALQPTTEKEHRLEELVEVREPIVNPHESFDVRSSFVRSDEDLMQTEMSNTPRSVVLGRAAPTKAPIVELEGNHIWD